MFTANTMAAVGEAIGMSLPGSASAAAIDNRRGDIAYASGTAVMQLLSAGIRPRHIMTKAVFENAIAVVMALGFNKCCPSFTQAGFGSWGRSRT